MIYTLQLIDFMNEWISHYPELNVDKFLSVEDRHGNATLICTRIHAQRTYASFIDAEGSGVQNFCRIMPAFYNCLVKGQDQFVHCIDGGFHVLLARDILEKFQVEKLSSDTTVGQLSFTYNKMNPDDCPGEYIGTDNISYGCPWDKYAI